MIKSEITLEELAEYAGYSRFQGELVPSDVKSVIRNPACGDQIELSINFNEELISGIRFQSQGCMISRACAAMLCERINGKPIHEVSNSTLADLLGFDTLLLTPQRRRCASLAFELLTKMLSSP